MSNHIKDFKERTEDAFDKEGCKKLIMEAEGVIDLLQKGEENKKYKQIVDELIDYFSSDERNIATMWILGLINKLKQKYFPKEERK